MDAAARPGALAAPGAALALVEAIDCDGLVRQAWRIDRWPVTIGRALDNTVVLSDAHVAAHHATIDLVAPAPPLDVDVDVPSEAVPAPDATRIAVTAGATRNGVAIGRDRLSAGESRVVVDTRSDLDLHVGRTQLRVRLAGQTLDPELVMAPAVTSDRHWLPTLAIALVVLLFVLATTWIDTDPDNFSRAAGAITLTTIAAGAIWCGLWALLSKTFTRQGHFGWHVRVFVIASLATMVLGALPPLVAFAFSWPWVTDFSFVAVYATVAAAIYFHLLAVEPARVRLMRAMAITGFVAGVALSLWFNVQRTGRPGEELYMNHLFPPQLRVARPVAVDRFVQELGPMQAILDRKAKEPASGDGDPRAGGDDDE
ncbi:MAG: hypothetical protein ABI218_16860 [Caldimonas sp.]